MSQAIDLCFSSTDNNTYPIDTSDKAAVTTFRQDNPHLIGNIIPAGTPFIMRGKGEGAKPWRESRPDLVCAFKQLQSLAPQARRNIANMNETYGADMVQAIADFYQNEVAPFTRQQSVGAIGAAATALDSRLSTFAKAAANYQQSLEKVRAASKAKLPKKQIVMLEKLAKNLGNEFQLKFRAEITKYLGKVKTSRRGSIYTNPQRGIDKAKSARSAQPIQFTNSSAFNNLRSFERGANFLGKGLIVIDAGVRAGNVHIDYLSGRNWQRRAAVEATGFGFGTAAGLLAGGAVVQIATGLGIALLATPVGWCIIIGSSIAIGILAAKTGDAAGQWSANKAYRLGSWVNNF